MKSIELFTGAGGLALGLASAGVRHEYLIERNDDACRTLLGNLQDGPECMRDWKVFWGDVRSFDYSPFESKVEIVGGGPPCQPFSLGGKHGGNLDGRDMFPEAVRAVAALKPKVFVFENVKGLLRQSFSSYFEYILLRLKYPELTTKGGEAWHEHLSRLEKYHTKGRHDGLFYRVVFRLLNAADYGVPQLRHRVFIVGFRCDLNREWSFPRETHSLDSLLYSQFVSGEYWDQHKVPKKNRTTPSTRYQSRVDRLRSEFRFLAPPLKRWNTVRDAIGDLPAPTRNGSAKLLNHIYRDGARSYPGHTGSPLDEPSKALKAGVHGVPGGENMLRYPDGRVRYYTVRESARIQTFPDAFHISGSWTEAMRQIGNAVPVKLAQTVGAAVVDHVSKN